MSTEDLHEYCLGREAESDSILNAIRRHTEWLIGRPDGYLTEARCAELHNLVNVLFRCAGGERRAFEAYHEAEQIQAAEEQEDLRVASFRRRQQAAHSAVAAAIASGALVRPEKCNRCPSTPKDIVAHHHDYDAPLDVEWLCRPCHGKHHAEHGSAK